MNNEQKGIIAIIVYQTMMGFSPMIMASISHSLSGQLLVAIRFGFAAAVLFPIILIKKNLRIGATHLSIKKLSVLLGLGIFGSGVASILNIVSIRLSGVITSTITTNMEIPIGMVLGMILFKEKISKKFVGIASVILSGFFLLLINGKHGSASSSTTLFFVGIGAGLIAAIIWGGCTVAGKVLLNKGIPPVVVTFYRLTAGSLVSLLLSLLLGNATISTITTIALSDWIKLGILGIVISGIGFYLYYTALSHLTIKKISLLFTIAPVVSVLTGVVIGEQYVWQQWLGIILIIGGIAGLLKLKDNL